MVGGDCGQQRRAGRNGAPGEGVAAVGGAEALFHCGDLGGLEALDEPAGRRLHLLSLASHPAACILNPAVKADDGSVGN